MKRESITKLFHYFSVGCTIVAFMFVAFYAGSSDYWTMAEPSATVPGNMDHKYIVAALISGGVALVFYTISRLLEKSLNLDEIEVSPVYCTDPIIEAVKTNRLFEMQICNFIHMFQNGVYGDLNAKNKLNNKKYARSGNGRLIGKYHSVNGDICIVTSANSGKTRVMFSKDYYRMRA